MGAFAKGGRIKSSFFVYAVCLSFLYIAIHVIMMFLLVEPVHNYFTGLAKPLSGALLNLFESGVPALLAAILCNVPVLFVKDKRLGIAGYLLVLAYLLVVVITVLITYEPETRDIFMVFFRTVMTAPLVAGFGVSGIVYAALKAKKQK